LASTNYAQTVANPPIAFPLRIRKGLLQKSDERDAYLTLIGIMARTPRGSWAGHPAFGFNEFFSEVSREARTQEHRVDLSRNTVEEINAVLADLGLFRYRVESLLPAEADGEPPSNYAAGAARTMAERSMTLMLRELGSDRVDGFLL
jgi:hypothetical protein